MNIEKTLIVARVLGITIVFVQGRRIKGKSKTIFKPHWFAQAQIGAVYTVGEGEFTDLTSLAAALNVGYGSAPTSGVRVGVGS